MNKYKKEYLKYIVAIFSLGTILLWPVSIDHINGDSLTSLQYDEIVKRYQSVKRGEQSELEELLISIIDDRLKCYEETSDYALRLSQCRKKYQYQILRAARENLKSSPSLGEFMICTQDCPLAYSFCNGEELSGQDQEDCRQIEALCIEVCLDSFWRGNSITNNTQ